MSFTRRKILGAALLAPLAALIPQMGTAVPKLGTTESYSDRQFFYICENASQRVYIAKLLADVKNVLVINHGAQICGIGADLIIVDEEVDQFTRWWHDVIETRRFHECPIVHAKWRSESFDWNTKSGIAVNIGGVRNAIKHWTKVEELTEADWARAKAQLIRWYVSEPREIYGTPLRLDVRDQGVIRRVDEATYIKSRERLVYWKGKLIGKGNLS